MTDTLTMRSLLRATLQDAGRMILPSLPWTALFVAMWTYLIWFATSYPEEGLWTLIFFGLTLLTLFTHSLFSVSLYHAVLPREAGILKSAWVLTLAWLLVITVMAIVFSGIALFYAMVAGSISTVLDIDVNSPQDITSQVMRDPTVTILFLTIFPFLLWIFWFVTRLMTFAAATSSRAKIHVFRTWGWTKGHFKTLGPLLFLLVFVPIGLGLGLAALVSGAVFSGTEGAVSQALRGALPMITTLPAAWLGHALAANVYKTVAEQVDIEKT